MKKIIGDFFQGLNYFFRAIGFVFRNNLWWAFFIPFLLTIVFFIAGWYSIGYLIEELNVWIEQLIGAADYSWLSYIMPVLKLIIWFLLKIGFFVFFSYFNGYLVLIVLSPLLAYLSETTEKIITGKDYKFSLKQFVYEVFRGVLISIRNFFYENFIYLLLILIVFIPIVGQIVMLLSPIILFFVSSYFYGFSFIDYSNERRKLNLRKSVMFVRNNKGVSIAFGSIYALILMVPFVGSFLAGLVSIVSVVAASMWYVEKDQKKNNFLTNV